MTKYPVSDVHEKFILAFAKRRELEPKDALEKILSIAVSRINAVENYAAAQSGEKPAKKVKAKKSAKKAEKPAKVAKAAGKKASKKMAKAKPAKAAKAQKASSKKANGVPKGFKKKAEAEGLENEKKEETTEKVEETAPNSVEEAPVSEAAAPAN